MEVILAGYNIDTELMPSLAEGQRDGRTLPQLTPETIAAAYARISRSEKRVDELRQETTVQVEAARKSNSRIVFDMGHSSIAEHAVFNIDVIGVSRLLVEDIQHFRLCSFTEKSQRYVTLNGDFVVPQEILGSPWESEFRDIVAAQNDFYFAAIKILIPQMLAKHSAIAATPAGRTSLEINAKEDARYVLSLATQSQMGMTINARNLALMVRRLGALPMTEAQQFSAKLLEVAQGVAPSLIRYTAVTEYDKETRNSLAEAFGAADVATSSPRKRLVNLLLDPRNAPTDDDLLATLLFSSSCMTMEACRREVASMSALRKKRLFATAFAKMNPFDAPLREFEALPLTFEVIVSATCFAQIKRHRMASIHCQPYDTSLGVTVPPSIREAGLEKQFIAVIKRTENFYQRLREQHRTVASYILTNAHRRRLLLALNARELYHLSRLRMDEHAQWDIRFITTEMIKQARRFLPLTLMMAGGKDGFAAMREKLPPAYEHDLTRQR
ncbi:MAG: FAD-dependent thymidylate synthase [Deltaproteobacteria bacterium]|nr:FAD-dependent thymidylate synthase [Deltaproteobacteria bacterium]